MVLNTVRASSGPTGSATVAKAPRMGVAEFVEVPGAGLSQEELPGKGSNSGARRTDAPLKVRSGSNMDRRAQVLGVVGQGDESAEEFASPVLQCLEDLGLPGLLAHYFASAQGERLVRFFAGGTLGGLLVAGLLLQ